MTEMHPYNCSHCDVESLLELLKNIDADVKIVRKGRQEGGAEFFSINGEELTFISIDIIRPPGAVALTLGVGEFPKRHQRKGEYHLMISPLSSWFSSKSRKASDVIYGEILKVLNDAWGDKFYSWPNES